MNTRDLLTSYWNKKPDEVRNFFTTDSVTYLHDSNEVMTTDDWVNHYKEPIGEWHTTVDRIESLGADKWMTITFHRSPSWNGFVTSIFTIDNGLIKELHEYYSPCDDNIVPQWRDDLKDEERI